MEQTQRILPERRKLADHEIALQLSKLKGWKVENGQIAKVFTFDSYKSGLVFAVTVGHFSDRIDHHPDMFVGYQKVRIALSTHDLVGISTFDFLLANEIEGLC